MRTLALAVLTAAVLPAQREGWKDLHNRHIAEFAASDWLNLDSKLPPTRFSLKNRVYLLHFFQTTCSNCMGEVAKLSALHEK